jgi:hypothetical protein
LYRRHNDDSTELQVKTAVQLLWDPYASESLGKEGNYGAGYGD